MAGHSKWANIKHTKARMDAKRSKVFAKIAREITIAAKLHGGDPDMNPRLRLAVLKGRGAKDPLALTAANFVISVPIVALLLFVAPFETTPAGAALAIFSGAVTSGLGYALWYAILPSLGATRAAVAQLSAPVIAALGGALFLSEPVGARLIIASVLVLGGIGISLMPKR